MSETAKEAARRLAAPAIAKGFQPEALHTYFAADGSPLYWRIRAKHVNGDKWIRPMKLNGHGYELGEPAFANGKPLYRLDRIAGDVGAPCGSAPLWQHSCAKQTATPLGN